MAYAVVRLRRSLSVSNTFAAYSLLHAPTQPPQPRNPISAVASLSSPTPSDSPFHPLLRPRHLHSTSPSLYARNNGFDDDKLDPDAILFEGCDYNHWLITMDFPKDPKPTSEEMVETYVQTLAKVVGSVEEAKKRMYACSTTTYHGFQAVMDEETSKKFEGMPGVVFILPDSYIDPVNKEYGGDKYINGTIIPRPPPVQYGRHPRRSRNFEPNSGVHNQTYEGNQPYDRRSGQGDRRGYAPQQNYPSTQNKSPPGQGDRSPSFTNNTTPVAGARPPCQGSVYNQGNYNQGSPYPQQDMGYATAGQRDSGFQGQGQGTYRDNAFHGHGQGAYRDNAFQGHGQGARGDNAFQGQGARGDNAFQGHGQGAPGDNAFQGHGQGAPGDNAFQGHGQGARGDNAFQGQQQYKGQTQNFSPPPFQGTGFGQGEVRADGQYRHASYGQGASDTYGQRGRPGYEKGYTSPGDNSRFPRSSESQNTIQGGGLTYAPMGETGTKQGGY